ncbi:DUF2461 domain-containing protein [Hyphobacterium sp. CCMP332]|nr:DUF2461 domain-containing protein [Hyphobacterium sp. CCMP332]
MAFFSEDFHAFFTELSKNNNKEWFDKNRKRYEIEVKNPFKKFVEHLISKVHNIDPNVNIDAKDAIMRINRDIRFSKDKTPYKTQAAAVISARGRKNMSIPGQYFSLGLNGMEIYGGLYQTDKTQLYNIRQHISYNLKIFEDLINDPKFKKQFGAIEGEKNKIIPAEFKADAKTQALIYNKSFYYRCNFKPEVIVKENLDEIWLDCYKTGKPVCDFLYEGSQG